MKKLSTVTIVLILIASIFIPVHFVYAASPSATIQSDYSKVMNGSTFAVNVNITVPTMSTMNCVNVQVSATGGFSVLTGKQYFSSITSSKKVSFNIKAPSSAASGSIGATITYSSISSCAGTLSIINPFGISISSASPWVLKLGVNKTLCTLPTVLSGDPGAYVVSSKAKSFTTNTGKVSSPFSASVNLNPIQDTYVITFGYFCILPLPPKPATYSWTITKTVTVTSSGQTVYFP